MSEIEFDSIDEIIQQFKKDNYEKLYTSSEKERLEHLKKLFENNGYDFKDCIGTIEDVVEERLQKRQKQGIH